METTVSEDRTLAHPSVSVCMTTYNQENFVAQAIEGVLAQQGDIRIDLTIGEDCSTDTTRSICESYAALHPDLIRLIPTAANLGVMANFFRTLGYATGKYVALCEGDDYWCDPQKLQKQVDWLESHPECGLVYSQVRRYLDSQKRFLRNWGGPGQGETTLEQLLKGNCIPTPSIVIRRELLDRYIGEVKPQERNWMMGDYPMWLYAATHSQVRFIDEPTAVYRILSESASHFKSFDKIDRFCLSSLDIRRYFAERYAPQTLPAIEEHSLWERLDAAVNFRNPQVAAELFEAIRQRGLKIDTKARRRTIRHLTWRYPFLWLKRKRS